MTNDQWTKQVRDPEAANRLEQAENPPPNCYGATKARKTPEKDGATRARQEEAAGSEITPCDFSF